MATSIGRKLVIAAAASASLLVSACATETRYRPARGQGFARTGFTDRQLENNRFLVSFAGNSVTPRETVERYLLFRAAEVTLQNGDDHFIMVDRDSDLQSRTFSRPGLGWGAWGPGFGWGPGWGGWGPGWGGFGGFGGWGGWGPGWGGFGGLGGWTDIDTVMRYESVAEILTGKGPPPANNVRAFDARQVLQRLGPTIQLPGQDRRSNQFVPTYGYGPNAARPGAPSGAPPASTGPTL